MKFYSDNMHQIYQGHAIEVLRELPENSVHCCVTSPPFWSLRRYECPELIWDDHNGCEHEWGEKIPIKETVVPKSRKCEKCGQFGITTRIGESKVEVECLKCQYKTIYEDASINESYSYEMDYSFWKTGGVKKAPEKDNLSQGQFCVKCGAWRGSLGLEPTPELYIQHLVQVFREVKRVLRDDGILWVNIDDSYASSASGSLGDAGWERPIRDAAMKRPDKLPGGDVKPLDLCGIPEMFFLAMRADGWYVRSRIAWNKPNPMPESVSSIRWQRHKIKIKAKSNGKPDYKGRIPESSGIRHTGDMAQSLEGRPDLVEWQDCPGCPKCSPNDGYVLRKGSWRPTDAWEYIFMLTKSDEYYSDMEAVREVQTGNAHSRGTESCNFNYQMSRGSYIGFSSPIIELPAGRNMRNVWIFPTQGYGVQMCKACKMIYQPSEFQSLRKRKGEAICSCGRQNWLSHYATFPLELPLTCIKASTSERGVCPSCGKQWARIIDTNYIKNRPSAGWRPTCQCGREDTVPAVVLDPFMGTGTTLEAASNLGCKSIGIDLSEDYCILARERFKQGVLV